MSHKSIDSCTFKLNSWKPFHTTKTLIDSKPQPSYSKRPCLSDRATTSFAIDSLDFSNLTLYDGDLSQRRGSGNTSLRLSAGKRRRRGSRSVSGRSSDRSGNNRRCCSVAAGGTDTSGELFVNNGGEVNWASDVSEARSSSRKGRECGMNGAVQFAGVMEGHGNESGYGSEPGYRGDVELGYGDEFDEEEDDHKPLFWGDQFESQDTKMEVVGENSFSEQKAHHRCRRKKHDCSRMMDTTR